MGPLASNLTSLFGRTTLLLCIAGGLFYFGSLAYGGILLAIAKGDKAKRARGIQMFENVAVSLIILTVLLGVGAIFVVFHRPILALAAVLVITAIFVGVNVTSHED